MKRRKLLCVLVVVATVGGVSAGSAWAANEAPGWKLFAANYPTHFTTGVDEVQQVTPEAATFTLTYAGAPTSSLSATASATEVQSAIEALSTVGTNDVAVARPTPTSPYEVTFTRALGQTKVATLESTGASVSVTTEGAASGTISVDVFNIGAGATSGQVTIKDKLPPGITAKEAGELAILGGSTGSEKFGVDPLLVANVWDCSGNGAGPPPGVAGATELTCTNDPVNLQVISGGGGTGTFENAGEGSRFEPPLGIAVGVESGAPEGTRSGPSANQASISGGGAERGASTSEPVTISASPPSGGGLNGAPADAWFSNADGTVDLEAGSHPYAATFIFTTNTAIDKNENGYLPGGEIRDLETRVPAGIVGDLHRITQCSHIALQQVACPPSSMVGRLVARTFAFGVSGEQVFNLVPRPGAVAELGYEYEAPVYISFEVNSGGDYSVTAHVNDLVQKGAYESILTLWGTPAAPSHNPWRLGEGGCGSGSGEGEENGPEKDGPHPNYCRTVGGEPQIPILRLPTSCAGPERFAFRELSGWQEPGQTSESTFESTDANEVPAGFTGCESLDLQPGFSLTPETRQTDAPTGVTAEVRPPLAGAETPQSLAPADLKNTTVTLPAGLVINPGQAAGLQSCPDGRPSPGEYGNALTTTEERAQGDEDNEPASCPPASKVGTVKINSPAIEGDPEKQFEGNVYILPSNPPEIKLLVAASADGVNLKLVGVTRLDKTTGQVTTVFENTPQLPFTNFTLNFQGGAKATLATPAHCGTYATDADFQPWSSPFALDSLTSSSFALSEGPGGSACPSTSLPFAPTFVAGTSTESAGQFGTFSTLVQRGDGTQRVESFRFTSPAGLSGLISSVPLCGEPQASQGTCSSASQIGHAIVTSGPGSNPLTIPQPGEPEAGIYLTGPYKGAPFGLSIVTPVKAGPFDLGTIVTRAKIEVDPTTAQVTVTTDPLPQIVKGVPTDLRSIYAVIDRQGFFFNPTNCEPQQFTGSAQGTGAPGQSEPGQSAPLSSRFAVNGCRGLTFAPNFAASTQGNGEFNHNGASLNVKIATNQGPKASAATPTEANIKKVEVALPVQLPSRLTTLQKACTEKQFAANPAGCPSESNVGTVTARTPVLPVPLNGPAYLVSHGNEAFPDLEIILQGDGVTIVLVGHTQIKNGVTFSRFETVPDAPVSSFELNLPEGKFSALGTNGTNLCKSTKSVKRKKRVAVRRHGRTIHVTKTVTEQVAAPLEMPTTITAQNGAVVKQTTKVAVTRCAKPKPAKAKKKARKPSKRRKH
jgi:hypothetical protein